MPRITVHRRLRPVRLAFLIAPGDLRELRRAFQLNTVLWGGRYNFIVPAYARAPASLGTRLSGKAVVAGYLNAIEPDFVVTGKKVDAAKYGIAHERVVSMGQMLSEGVGDVGLSVQAWYQHAYDETFAFELRQPARLLDVRAGRRLRTFSAAVFGAFPDGRLAPLREGFETLGGKTVDFSPDLLDLNAEIISPVVLGSSWIAVRGFRWRAAMVLDPENFGDLVDYWNLRAFGWHVLPVPLGDEAALLPVVGRFLAHDARLPGAPILKARSVSREAFETFAKQVPFQGKTVQNWMPRPWYRGVRSADHVSRPVVVADDDHLDVAVEKGRFSFQTLAPDFHIDLTRLGGRAWANVIELRSVDLPDLAEIIPTPIEEVGRVVAHWELPGRIHVSSEGLTTFDDGRGGLQTWNVPTGIAVMTAWLKPQYVVSLSTCGRLTKRLLDVLGGPERTRTATHPEMIRLFDEVSRSASRSAAERDFFGRLQRVHKNNDVATKNVLRNWLESGVLGMGLCVQCAECGQENWYALDGLKDRLRCERCLESFPFPGVSPRSTTWSYRPLGPFAVEGHAKGAFVVAAALRVLNAYGDRRTTWVPSIEFRRGKDQHLEADFAMLSRPDAFRFPQPQLILGECKTFGPFQQSDVDKMKQLAVAFPETTLVFASMTDRLTGEEIDRLGALAKWGRKKWRAGIAVLTRQELASDFGPPMCWKDGNAVAQSLEKAFRGGHSVRRLCDATQQIHLGLPPSEDWPHHDAP